MNPVLKVLFRCIVVEFYKQNAAFFGLNFLVFFGFIKSSEHIAIGSFLVANPSTLFFLYILWVGYCIKVLLFTMPVLNHDKNQFFEAFFLLGSWTKIRTITISSIVILAPILAYGLFLIGLAIIYSFYISVISVLVSCVIMLAAITHFLLKKLDQLPFEKTFLQIKFLNKIAKPYSVFFVEYLLRNDPVLFLLTKIYSCLMIVGASALYKTDQFDIRLLSTGILLALVGNVAILHKYIWFSYYKMINTLNLPISLSKRIFNKFTTFLLLIVPEAAIILRYYPLPPTVIDVFGTMAFAFSLTTLIYGLLLLKQVELSNFIIYIFWLIVLTTFLILFSIHPAVLAAFYLVISSFLIYFRIFKFEFVEKAH